MTVLLQDIASRLARFHEGCKAVGIPVAEARRRSRAAFAQPRQAPDDCPRCGRESVCGTYCPRCGLPMPLPRSAR